MSALPVTTATASALSQSQSHAEPYTFETLCAALVARGIRLDARAAHAGRLEVDAPRGALTPDLRAALTSYRAQLLKAINATPPPMRPVSVCKWGAPHFGAWDYHAGERRFVCRICFPQAWDSARSSSGASAKPSPKPSPKPAKVQTVQKEGATMEDTTPEANRPEAPAQPQETTQDQPQGGAMMRLERDASGLAHAVPATVTYFETTGAASAPLAALASLEAGSDQQTATPHAGRLDNWRIWRATDAEPGDAPRFDDLNARQRAAWFDGFDCATDDGADAAACRGAWARLCGWIAREYPGCHALTTPGATGLTLLHHTLPWGKGQPRPYRYAALPADLARLLAATAPLHRTELLTEPGRMLRRYTVFDARVAHAAYLRHLPVLLEDASTLIHDDGPYIPYRAGKYRVAVTVPQGWAHIGLAHRAGQDGQAWEWPATPGTEWETWLDESAVRLLANNPQGIAWPFAVRERLLFAEPKAAGVDPLREHAARVTGWLERLDREAAAPGATARQARETRALRAAARALAINPIGMWHKRDNQRERTIARLDDLTPEDAAAMIVPTEAGGYTVTTPAALSAYQAHWRRVEWSTTVYAREQVVATRKALEAPRSALLAIRGDACHFADYAPDAWRADTGKVGAYRVKFDRTYPRARRAPQTTTALLALAAEKTAEKE